MGLLEEISSWDNVWCVLDLGNEKDPRSSDRQPVILERENTRLVGKVVELTNELLALKGASPEDLQLKIAQLEAQLAVRNRLLFGKSSEKRPVEKAAPSEKKVQSGHGPREQPALPWSRRRTSSDRQPIASGSG